MKTFIVLIVVVLFVLTLRYYLKEQKDCKNSCSDDKRIDKIDRARKNLHPKININVDRDSKGRFCKKN